MGSKIYTEVLHAEDPVAMYTSQAPTLEAIYSDEMVKEYSKVHMCRLLLVSSSLDSMESHMV